ncbi:MAG: cupin domain-containing protein [Solirubrobacterales bacterium]
MSSAPGEDAAPEQGSELGAQGSEPGARPERDPVVLGLGEMNVSPTAALFEGDARAPGFGVDTSIFVTRTPPGGFVELHVHPYPETFILLAGNGRWTSGESAVELGPDGVIVVPADTPHGFRNIGDEPLLVVSIHERGTIEQRWLGREPA